MLYPNPAARHPSLIERLLLISANAVRDLPAMLLVFERRGGPTITIDSLINVSGSPSHARAEDEQGFRP